ncbi:NAD-dependent epimerase/dehydratase family protein [Komagataeibacter swingsii]|uniref:NAD-dependent epimerase/dehydratase family protein n=1 Tax=Komagataeibacter swingsii TaxID=215220 RepID=A0A850P0S3_9PROT|nr:NAD-dependent epimerase/dehydratase family protein [Komagataeibacter swingsii]NVN38267.1 NAD-dependent epimerase/dehydratase family protein [Komagataeibacter swingsii]
MTTRVLLVGGTGLIGRSVNAGLATRPDTIVTSLTRRQSSGADHVIDFERLCAAPETALHAVAPTGADVAISCLGTTIRAAGSQAAMFRVDHDYVLAFATAAHALGARQFILVSSVGAGGPGFYLRTKGMIERDIRVLGFSRIDILRPGMLLGHRAVARPMEAIGQRLAVALAPFMVGRLSRYGAIDAETVAKAIVALVGQTGDGCRTYDNADLRRIVSQAACL